MTEAEVLSTIRFVTDPSGVQTDVLVPVEVWNGLLNSLRQMAEKLEDQEDADTVREWLSKRAKGEVEMISLEDFKQELLQDGLLSD